MELVGHRVHLVVRKGVEPGPLPHFCCNSIALQPFKGRNGDGIEDRKNKQLKLESHCDFVACHTMVDSSSSMR
jgi:hypothetical protein